MNLLASLVRFYRRRFIWMIVLGIVLGGYLGGVHPELGRELGLLGEIFLSALKMIVVPLVIFTMIVGVTSLGSIQELGGIGGRTILYYMLTTFMAVALGLVLVNVMHPGKGAKVRETFPEIAYRIEEKTFRFEGGFEQDLGKMGRRSYMVRLLDQRIPLEEGEGDLPITGVIKSVETTDGRTVVKVKQWVGPDGKPVEPKASGEGFEVDLEVAAKVRGKETRTLSQTIEEILVGDKNGGGGIIPRNLFRAMANLDLLPLISFSLLFGAVLTTLGERGKPVVDLAVGMDAAIMRIVHLIIFFTPFGVLGLTAGRIGTEGGWVQFLPELKRVGWYSATVVVGLAIHGFIVLPLLLSVFARRNPLPYLRGMAQALLTAFSTASSSGTLPVTIESSMKNNRVSERTSSFVLPLGATINMDGTALYEAVAVLFIAQSYGIDLSIGQQIIVLLTATLAAIGAAGIPEAGLVTMVIVLKAVGLPLEGITLILIVDWLLDRCRTTINVWGDAVGAGIIDRYENLAAAKVAPTGG